MFTGKQQRDGVSMLPFIMAGLFAVDSGRRAGPVADGAATAWDGGAPVELVLDNDMDDEGDDDGYDADVEAAKLSKSFKFDWAKYRAVWHDTPIHQAIVEVFAEYACLYARISGQVCSTVPPPMTLSTGLSIAEQASRFVLQYVTPVLGELQSTKIHKLLRHVMDSTKWHGHLQNGNTAENESIHKHDKPFYFRTNKHVSEYTNQVVVFSRGSQEVLAKLDAMDARASTHLARAASLTDSESNDSDGFASCGGNDGAGTAPVPPRPSTGVATTKHLQKMTVAALEALPDLEGLGSLLGLDGSDKVAVPQSVKFRATMDCGTVHVQTVRSTESFYHRPWHDAVLYRADPEQETVSVGEARALIRMPGGDVAVLCEMEPVAPEPGCPFSRRGCTRLAWRVAPRSTRIALRVVPVSSIRRLLFVVPDFAELSARHGPFALPPHRDGDQAERLAMRFFVNAMHPWNIVKQ